MAVECNRMKKRNLVLGVGFGGLGLSTMLSEAFGDGIEVTVIDKSDAFYFGFSKLDGLFCWRTTPDAVRLPYKEICEARHALPPGNDHINRSHREAPHDRPWDP